MTTRGAPLVYYGDEVGMPGAGDPDNRRFMQWDGLLQRPAALLNDASTKLTAIRAAHPATSPRHPDHPVRRATTPSPTTMTFGRRHGATWPSTAATAMQTVGGIPAGDYTDELTGDMVSGPQVQVPPRSALVLAP